ncbi:MAG: HU family DNA-binding protein [Clostridia bacterium]|nr:HU family DNA-binding protein [Clostridia bacterium]
MNKKEIIAYLGEKTNVSKKDCALVLNAFIDMIPAKLKAGQKIQLVGFGTFEAHKRAARKGTNPRSGKAINIKACTVPAFKAGKGFKDAVK